MKLTGYVTIGDRRGLIDWTISEDGVESSGGIGAEEISISGLMSLPTEEVLVTDDYDLLTVVDLKVLLTERAEPIYGNKEQLIGRLRAWDAANPSGLTVAVAEEPAMEDLGESEEVVEEVADESGDTVE